MAPTFRHGKSTRIFINEKDLSSILNSASVDGNVDTVECTAFADNDRKYVPGFRSATVSFEGMADFSTDEADAMFDTQLGGSTDSVITYAPEGTAVGRRAVLIEGVQTSRTITNPLDGVVSASVSYEANNGPRYGIVLGQATNSTGSTFASALIGSTNATSTKGGIGHLHITGLSTAVGNDVVVTIQDSSDDVTFADLITFTVDTTGPTVRSSTVSGAVKEFLRARSTGTSTSVSFMTAFAINR